MSHNFDDQFPRVAQELAQRERQLAEQENQEAAERRQLQAQSEAAFRADVMGAIGQFYTATRPLYAEREKILGELLPVMRKLIETQNKINFLEVGARDQAYRIGLENYEIDDFMNRMFRQGLPPWRAPGRQPADRLDAICWPAIFVLLQSNLGA